MYDFENNEIDRTIFLNLVWKYINISNPNAVVTKHIGARKALELQFFIADFFESHYEEAEEFLKTYKIKEKGGI